MSTEIFLVDFADLSCKKLSVQQKNWLVNRINSKAETASSLAKRYKLNINKLHQYVCRSRKGKTFHFRGGRPRVFSEDSIKELAVYANKSPKPSMEDVKARIKEIFFSNHQDEDVSDDLHALNQEKRTGISKRSVNRYATLCYNLKIVDLATEKHE